VKRPVRIRALLLAALGVVASPFAASGDLLERGSPPLTLMSFTFGSGRDQIDTSAVDPADPFRTIVQSFRVESDGTVWILSGGLGAQTLRHFRSAAGLARESDVIALPGDRGTFGDFVFFPGGIVLSRLIGSAEDLAAFSRFEPGKGICEEVLLPHDAGFNRYRGQRIANLGRLRVIADTLYDCFDPNGSCVRIGSHRLFRELSAKDVTTGSPTIMGKPVWCDRLRVFQGIDPIVDLTKGGPAVIEEVFEDGSFVIRRISDEESRRANRLDLYEMYTVDGRLLRSLRIPRPDPGRFGVGDGSELCLSIPWIYRLAFGRNGVDLERY
jgi:hypothetical protein